MTLFVIVAVAKYLGLGGDIMTMLIIILNYLQLLNIFFGFELDWPDFVTIFNLSLFSLDITAVPAECTFPVSYEMKLIIVLLFPVVVLLVVASFAVAAILFALVLNLFVRTRGDSAKGENKEEKDEEVLKID